MPPSAGWSPPPADSSSRAPADQSAVCPRAWGEPGARLADSGSTAGPGAHAGGAARSSGRCASGGNSPASSPGARRARASAHREAAGPWAWRRVRAVADIDVTSQRVSNGWLCRVTIAEGGTESTHTVAIRDEDLDRLAAGATDPTDLVRRSFAFLLEREPKEAI